MTINNIFTSVLTVLMFVLAIKGGELFTAIQDTTKYALGINAGHIVHAASAENDANTKPKDATTSPEIIELKKLDSAESTDKKEENNQPAERELAGLKTNVPALMALSTNNDEARLLTELSSRRRTLDKQQKDLQLKENILKVTETKLEQKMQELATLRAQVEEVVSKYNRHESEKLMSLVKIYENMKPREAAKIFDELELPVLISIVTKMKELKVAPVIAAMNPSKAKELSVELAKQDPIEGYNDSL